MSIKSMIYADLTRTGTKTSTVIRALSMTDRTFYKRMKDPDTLTAREIRILRRFCSKETCDAITQ